MLRVADSSSPSLSVMVAVSLTRLSAASVVDWSGPLSGVCTTARFWSSVTLPEAVDADREHQVVAASGAAFNDANR